MPTAETCEPIPTFWESISPTDGEVVMRRALWLLVFFPLLILAPAGEADEAAGNAARGKVVYERYCVSCHGDLGNGEGEFAEYISPKPRDYRQGTFKWRSTPSGSADSTSTRRTIACSVRTKKPWKR